MEHDPFPRDEAHDVKMGIFQPFIASHIMLDNPKAFVDALCKFIAGLYQVYDDTVRRV